MSETTSRLRTKVSSVGRRLLVAAAGGSILAAGMTGLVAGPASAAPADGVWTVGAGYMGDDGYYIGNFVSDTGNTAYCFLQDDKKGPRNDDPMTYNDGGLVDTFQYTVERTDGSFIRGTATEQQTAAIAYIVNKWGTTSDAGTAAMVKKAVYTIVGHWDDSRWSGIYGGLPSVQPWIDEANSQVGPYSLAVDIVPSPDFRTATVIADLTSPSGGHPTRTINMSTNGSAIFQSTGTSQWQGTVADANNQVIEATQSSNVRVEASSLVPGYQIRQLTPAQANHQRRQTLMAVSPDPDTVQANSSTHPLVAGFEIGITSQVTSFPVDAGQHYEDTVSIALTSGDWIVANGSAANVKLVSTLHGFVNQPVPSSTIPADAPVLDVVEWTANGVGDYPIVSNITVDGAQGSKYAAWTTVAIAADQDHPYLLSNADDGYFAPSETHVVRVNPEVVTERAEKFPLVGDVAIDNITLTLAEGQEFGVDRDGNPITIPVNATLIRLGDTPLVEVPLGEIPADATVIGSEVVTFSEAGTQPTPGGLTYPSEGAFTWVTEVIETDYYTGHQSNAAIIEESSYVRYPITHTSESREYNVHPGGKAFDSMTNSGIPAFYGDFDGIEGWEGDSGKATVRVLGPTESEITTEVAPEGTPVFWEEEVDLVNGTIRIGDGNLTSEIILPETTTFNKGDHYVFQFVFEGDSRVAPLTSPANDAWERFFVPGPNTPLTVTTRALPEAIGGVTQAYDEATINGTVPEGSLLEFDYYEVPRADGTADCVAPTAEEIEALKAAGPTGTVTFEGTVTSNSVHKSQLVDTRAENYCIFWVERLLGPEGPDGERPVLDEGEIGTPGETTKVVLPEREITVTTQATSEFETARGGDDIWDVINVSGDIQSGDTTVVELFKWKQGSTPVCDDVIWTSEPIELVPGTFIYETNRYTTPVDVEGWNYGFVETTRDVNGKIVAQGTCAEPTETIPVGPSPKVSTTAESESGSKNPVLGDKIRDTLKVEGTVREGDWTTVELFRTEAGKAPQCDADTKVWESDKILLIPGTTEYATNWYTPTDAGTHYFVETSYDADGNVLSKGVCGEPDETITVSEKPVTSSGPSTVKPVKPGSLASTGATGTILGLGGIALVIAGAAATILARRKGLTN